jgi:hypothetical protein
MDSLNKAGKDIFGSGQPLAVEQFLDEGASDEQDGSGKAAGTLSKLSKGAALGGLAFWRQNPAALRRGCLSMHSWVRWCAARTDVDQTQMHPYSSVHFQSPELLSSQLL